MSHRIDIDGAPHITLGEKLWPVPILSARQNKVIDPLILGLLPVFARWQSGNAGALSTLGAEQYDALLEIAFHAIRRASPSLTRDEFLDLAITLPELIAAFSTIAEQTGVFQKVENAGDEVGEA